MGRLNRPPPPRQPAPDTITQRFTYFPARQAHLLKPTILQRRTRALGRVHTATTAVPVRRPTKWREWRRPWTRALTRITPFLPPDRGWIRARLGLCSKSSHGRECPSDRFSAFMKIYLGCHWMRLLSKWRRGATRRLFCPCEKIFKVLKGGLLIWLVVQMFIIFLIIRFFFFFFLRNLLLSFALIIR